MEQKCDSCLTTLRLYNSVCNTWSICGMILKGDNVNIWGIICQTTALCTASPTWICLGLKPGLHGERRAPNRRRHDTVDNFHSLFSLDPENTRFNNVEEHWFLYTPTSLESFFSEIILTFQGNTASFTTTSQ